MNAANSAVLVDEAFGWQELQSHLTREER